MSALSGIDIALWDLKGECKQTYSRIPETPSHVMGVFVFCHVTAPFISGHVPSS
jgi:hypothetical protein